MEERDKQMDKVFIISKEKLRENPEKCSRIPNALIFDERISGLTLSIYLFLASQKEGWEVNHGEIKNKLEIKSEEVYARAWKELRSTGWVQANEKSDYVLMSCPYSNR